MLPAKPTIHASRSMFAPVASLGVPDVPPDAADDRQLLRLVRELAHTVDRLQDEVDDLKRRV